MNIQDWCPLELAGLISLQSKGLSWVPRLPLESINSSEMESKLIWNKSMKTGYVFSLIFFFSLYLLVKHRYWNIFIAFFFIYKWISHCCGIIKKAFINFWKANSFCS